MVQQGREVLCYHDGTPADRSQTVHQYIHDLHSTFEPPSYIAAARRQEYRRREDYYVDRTVTIQNTAGLRIFTVDVTLKSWIEGRTIAPGSVAIAEPFQQPAAKILEIDHRFQNLQQVANFAQPLKMLRKFE
jgi:hypothetical protein